MERKKIAIAALVIGVLGIALEAVQIVLYESHLSAEWSYPASQWNYLAFFTVITNLMVDLWLVAVALSVFFKWKRVYSFLTLPAIQGALVLYISTVGIVYCTLLFWFIGPYSMELWWANLIDMWNHLILPVGAVILFWLTPHTRKLNKSTVGWWLVWPVVYFLLSEIRGLVWDWYPYPFLKPSWFLFPFGITVTVGCFVGIGFLIVWLHNKKVDKLTKTCPYSNTCKVKNKSA